MSQIQLFGYFCIMEIPTFLLSKIISVPLKWDELNN